MASIAPGSIGWPLAEFLFQVLLVSLLMPGVLHAWLFFAAPMHSFAEGRWGTWAAMGFAVVLTVVFVNVVAVLQTVPIFAGIRFGKIQVNKFPTGKQVMSVVPIVCLNSAISIVFGTVTLHASAQDSVLRNLTVDIPSNCVIAGTSAVCLCITELVFYHMHRLFHTNKTLYTKIHKLHHTWPSPIALTSTYAHPVEHILCNLGSVAMGPALLGAHPVLSIAFGMLFAIGAQGHHSGYWNDDLGMHDLHHERFNCNFGNAHLLDSLYGTYRCKESFMNAKTN